MCFGSCREIRNLIACMLTEPSSGFGPLAAHLSNKICFLWYCEVLLDEVYCMFCSVGMKQDWPELSEWRFFSRYIRRTTPFKESMDHRCLKTDDCPIRYQVSDPWRFKEREYQWFCASGKLYFVSRVSLVEKADWSHGETMYLNPHQHLFVLCPAIWWLPTSSHLTARTCISLLHLILFHLPHYRVKMGWKWRFIIDLFFRPCVQES